MPAHSAVADAFLCAPDGEPAPAFLAQEAGRFVSAVMRLHEAAASRFLDGPFGQTDTSLRLRSDGTQLLTLSGAIPLTGLRLPSTAVQTVR
ncbi:hypothetical protein ACIRS1_25355 [Kitasatospora sp. NPDC101176]|uniref:hypothetical protein n=1 Tax=Kitasatospora sp. NPDC101176 TaxID=3364099 RepID=UPI0037FE63BA